MPERFYSSLTAISGPPALALPALCSVVDTAHPAICDPSVRRRRWMASMTNARGALGWGPARLDTFLFFSFFFLRGTRLWGWKKQPWRGYLCSSYLKRV